MGCEGLSAVFGSVRYFENMAADAGEGAVARYEERVYVLYL